MFKVNPNVKIERYYRGALITCLDKSYAFPEKYIQAIEAIRDEKCFEEMKTVISKLLELAILQEHNEAQSN